MAEILELAVTLIFWAVKTAFWAIYFVVYLVLRAFGVGDRLPAPQRQPPGANGSERSHAPGLDMPLPQVLAGGIALLLLGGTVAGGIFYERMQRERERSATALAARLANRLDPDQSPVPAREPGLATQVLDPWGQPLRVVYRDHITHETLEIRSAGRDSVYDTRDDPVVTRRTLTAAGRVAVPVAGAAVSAAIGGALKAWEYREAKKEEAIEEANQANP